MPNPSPTTEYRSPPRRPDKLARSALQRALGVRLPLFALAAVALTAAFVAALASSDREASLRAELERSGLLLKAGSVRWLEPSRGPLHPRAALFLARRGEGLDDLYLARSRTTNRGEVLDLWGLTNASRSAGAEERDPIALCTSPGCQHVLFTVYAGGAYDAVVLLDLGGEPPELTADWPLVARLENRITNLQDTGQLAGVAVRRYRLEPPAASVRAHIEGNIFVLEVDGTRVVIDPESEAPVEGAERLHLLPMLKAQPATLPWAVDTVRSLSWVGPEAIAWLEHTVFGMSDRAQRAYRRIVPLDTGEEARRELALPRAPQPQQPGRDTPPPPGPPDWPPPALAPLLSDPVRGEGQWTAVADPHFVNHFANAPHAFYQTFVRADPERAFTRVYVTAWDPRQVQLHVAMGTREPQSATGETGSGMIPREPDTLERLVGAFNGGFQAVHGEFGMMADGRMYLPPKPYAATVAVFENGHVAMGSWPGPPPHGWTEQSARAQIPDGIVALRQNLTSVVEDRVYNPWGRWWWGAAPPHAREQTYIHRSGICLTQEGFMAYFWGPSMGPEALGAAMLQTRCRRGLHLDMNAPHCGFEFYRTQAAGAEPDSSSLPNVRRIEETGDDWRFDGPMPMAADFRVRARKAVRSMSQMRFPRYLQRDPRDFFYLTLKPTLPGPDLQAPDGQRWRFSSQALPAKAWPRAFARVNISYAGSRTTIVRIDPARLSHEATGPELGSSAPRVGSKPLAYLKSRRLFDSTLPMAIYREPGVVGARWRVGMAPPGGQVMLRGRRLNARSRARHAIGTDRHGFLVYLERTQGPADWPQVLKLAEVVKAVELASDARLTVVGEEHPLGSPDPPPSPPPEGLAWRARMSPDADVLFPETKPLPYRRWGYWQAKRVRYVRRGQARFQNPSDVVSK